ncbi:YjjG family noncanonical pyrimidine nucleotidase [Kineothrix sp. MB12-C1]|uniref:YjjG family noncanonical pyrimidine nucleotidase n=1 Tax=Kineothrix sp. MB12-C1 TaxID=3070215 RepID=UPI0027D234AD|nr:YjjG family noncanonical pyrimidine nucleotidase [Kineothrix sp. MB12-C1]WMC92687.1 YjjG family noncanonical pyrimidine nucleotidase [Kineothrix sp. MB12-C1]
MGTFKIILWDVDQTLLDFKKSESYAVAHCFEQFGLTATEEIIELYSGINESFWKRIEKGEIAKKDALIERFCTLFDKVGIKNINPEVFQEKYADALGSVYYFQDDSYELLKSLKGRYRQYLVTNGISYTQRKKLGLSGFDQLVEDIFVSEEIGVPKPQKEYFDYCFSRIPDFRLEQTIIVGDSLSSDMLGGNQAGITTCWYNPNGFKNNSDIKIDYEIRNLQEIKTIL